jgi:hypothetical protein
MRNEMKNEQTKLAALPIDHSNGSELRRLSRALGLTIYMKWLWAEIFAATFCFFVSVFLQCFC